ncbi:zinc-binding alcohol dehydrogenase family protein [Secundilactobacillus folii]|uniref:Zinc-type alcohol dehydrogenase-like protein n=1 Tax=Secundilactobacillus folii TaxID=2678357 RepID=A0A7X2XXM3_9LACO|nr:zinc-binding alcohol dehydrogenase family protein [Secundilactobacillus folii]MTV82813.1 zinc-binding alcohol dehydrogenase family protein [Secundilactobacillus folii]
MKAIGFTQSLPVSNENSLFEFDEPLPHATDHDLLVRVDGTSINPVDIGVRKSGRGIRKKPKVIGWDAVGQVIEIGEKVSLFKKGDHVFYAGSFKRPGSNSEYQLVDERIVGHAPQKLKNDQIAAMPLTSLTAWEALFEKLELDPKNIEQNAGKTILIINGSGGVGSIATQLAHIAGLNVIATASREKTVAWVKNLGADKTVNHHEDLVQQVRKLGYHYVDYILELNNINQHWNEMAELIKPNGKIASITENRQPVDLKKLTKKRADFSWEWMYSKSYYGTTDLVTQHNILEKIAKLLDQNQLKSTTTEVLSPITAANLRQAHKMVEKGHMMGKVVIVNN